MIPTASTPHTILAEPAVRSLEQVLGPERSTDPGSYQREQLWDSYRTDAASVNALLCTVHSAPGHDETEAAGGFIPQELRQQLSHPA